jgi:hydroxyacylglutathione hydrolase
MHQVADGVFQLPLTPRDGINAYVLGDVLVDAGIKQSVKRILGAVRGRPISAHALTHAHVDHAGGSKGVIAALGVPLWAGAADVEYCETGAPPSGKDFLARFGRFPPVTPDRALREGDEVAGFTVLDTPGHSPGHVSYWRESDRVLVCGDVFNNMNLLTTAVGLHEPPKAFSPDPARNRDSMRRLAALEPSLALFGHGPPLRDPEKLKAFAATLTP